MSKKLQENEILEYLNTSTTARGFFISAVDVFEQVIQTLIERIFLKNDFAVQSVVGPLLHDSGPLGELSVRLKLLFGLGVVPHDIYHDFEGIIKLKSVLNNDSAEYNFTDPIIVTSIEALHVAKKINMLVFEPVSVAQDEIDLAFYQMQIDRQQQVIKSSLALAIISLCEALDKDSPF
ncbi:MltR family transcriptional regulator [Psychromonas sp. psych-6C06]|uniref:MltR family transcriptional regulator n=1 Tax=Psychromonas sp. psych-6C06 TaxID=2058089 RepID=UPI000C347BE5|nr:MltR family transcriptional regulator [Psychromonas sp. psych-6C06]PKF60555.1 MltR family transcriptional regulator [Psychromonas sp. psych-6C06]